MKLIKKLIFFTSVTFLLLLVNTYAVLACEACKQRQPKLLQGITHGNGPNGFWDYFIVIIMVLVIIYTLFATIRCFVKPTEKRYKDIKDHILKAQ